MKPIKPRPPKREKPRRCAAVAVVGNEHPNDKTKGGPWFLCLSPSQQKKLFPHGGGPGPNLLNQPNPPLGCGAFACVWPDNGDVVKITNDPEDVEALLKNQDNPRVVRVREAFQLNRSGVSRNGKVIPVYAARVERLEPLPRQMQIWNKRFTTDAASPGGRGRTLAHRLLILQATSYANSGRPREAYTVDEETRGLANATACRGENVDREACERFTGEFLDTFQSLFRRGYIWGDHHYNNMAMNKDGRWQIIDLGQSGGSGKPDVKPLNGAELARVRKLLRK